MGGRGVKVIALIPEVCARSEHVRCDWCRLPLGLLKASGYSTMLQKCRRWFVGGARYGCRGSLRQRILQNGFLGVAILHKCCCFCDCHAVHALELPCCSATVVCVLLEVKLEVLMVGRSVEVIALIQKYVHEASIFVVIGGAYL